MVDDIVASVENNVIGYFADRFHYPPTAFKWDTNVRKAFNFDPAPWAEIADQFNRKDWMIKLHVLLAQAEMGSKNTIGDLTSLICDKLRTEQTFANLPLGSALAAARAAAKPAKKAAAKPAGKKAKKKAKKKVG